MIPASLTAARELGMDDDQFAAKRSLVTDKQTIFEACTEAALLAEHRAMETEGSRSPRPVPTVHLELDHAELFAVLDGLRWLQVSIAKRPSWISDATLSAMKKVNAAMVRR